jgi:tetratricopeptide (TPR) repeat protein
VTGSRDEIGGQVVAPVGHTGISLPAPVPAALAGLPTEEGFTGRAGELAVLADVLAPTGHGPVVSTVAGPPGVGKSALVVRAAHAALAAGWFAGGVLFVDLHGYDAARRVDAGTALAALLRALGVRGEHIPAEQGERETLYRSELATLARHGRRVLVVADNAADTDQVLPLRPGDPAHRILVTSRHTLPVPAARRVEVDVLPVDDAVTVLGDALRAADPHDDRVACEPAAAAELAVLCGHLPLALRITAQLLADHQDDPIADLVDVFSGEHTRLAELAYGDSVAVRVAFDASYRRLPDDQARLFRLLSLHPGPHFDRDVASALAGTPAAVTRHLLDGLRRAHLIQPALGSGRYRCHDLLLLYAAERCHGEETTEAQDAAIERLLDAYRATTAAAIGWIDVSAPDARSTRFADALSALAWLDAERPNLTAVVTLAADTGHDEHVLDLVDAVYPYFELRKTRTESIAVAERGVAAARWLGDGRRAAHCLARLGVSSRHLRRYDDALDHLRAALSAQREAGDDHGAAHTLNSFGAVYRDLRRPDEAEECLREAIALSRDCGDRLGEAISLNTLGNVYRDARRFDEALDLHRRALTVRRELGDRYGEAISLNNMANAFHTLRRMDEAVEHYRLALEIRRETGDREGEAISLNDLGRVFRHLGRHESAGEHFQQALAVQRATNDRAGIARTLSNLAHVHSALGRTDDAVDTFRRSAELYQEIGDRYGEGGALDGLANAYRTAGRCAEAVDCLLRSQEIRRATGDTFRLAITTTALGITYRAAHRFDDSLVALTEALALRRTVEDPYGEAITLAELGLTCHCTGRYDDAETHYRSAVAGFERTSAPDDARPITALLAQLAEDRTSGTVGVRPEREARD